MAMTAPLGKKPTACVPCHERKVRCDSTTVGFPCTRCTTKDRADSCIMLERGGKNSNKRRRTAADGEDLLSPRQAEEDIPVEQQTLSTSNRIQDQNPDYSTARILTPATSVNPQRHASFSHTDVANGLLELSHAGTSRLGPESLQPGTHRSDPGPPIQYLVSDEDAHLQTLYHMTDEDQVIPSPVPLTISEHGQQVIEYYGELNSVTVLSEVLGQSQRRLIRLDLPGPAAVGALQREFSRLDEADVAYLRGKHVHDFPPPSACRGFLYLFFRRVYPYTPILNRQQFFEDYERGNCSSFLLWSIFANVAPYASPELLLESGYTEYSMAQKAFFSKARLLYDFGCEKGQLNLLQGSILLSSFQFTFAPDKDFRFWFHNAARIALQMGLNRRDIGNDLDLPTYHLVRRIWWVIYSRDVWFSVVGFENARRIHDDGKEMALLTPEDWAEELLIPPHYKDIIPDITLLQQHFFTEICRLNLLGSHFLSLLGPNRPTPTLPEAHAFTNSITTWRTSFPEDLLLDRIFHWDDSNAWVLFLWSMGFRLECSFYRTLRQRTKGIDEESAAWANERLRRCIFELDTVLKRAVVNDVARFCPPSLIICTSHLLALQLEVALDPTAPEPQRIAAKTQIHTGLAYLRGIGDRWLNAKWTFRVFDSVTRRLGMPMGGHDLPTSIYPAGPSNDPGLWRHASVNTGSIAQMPIDLGQSQPQPQDELALPDRWIESLLTENLMNGLDDGMFNMFMP